MKTCGRCKQSLPLEAFNKNAKYEDGLHRDCRECKKVYQHEWYLAHRVEQLDRVRKRNQEHRKDVREWLDSLKNQPCTDCGQTYPAYVMDYDHLPGTCKVKHVSAMGGSTKEQILEEVAKCELVCSNCHRIRTHARLRS